MDDLCPVVSRVHGGCFLVLCEDGPGAPGLRERDLAAHLEHVERHWRRYLAAGPLRTPSQSGPDGSRIIGSLFLVLATDETEARTLMAGDPYFANGQYHAVRFLEFTPAIGRWLGGKIWADIDTLSGTTR